VGELAVLGFAVNLLIILLGFPAFLLFMQSRKKGTAPAVEMEHSERAPDARLPEGSEG
jgi:hypothetical protein